MMKTPANTTMGVLLVALVANAASLSFVLVVLPPLGRQLGFTDLQTGALLSLSALLLTVCAPFWGYASERFGRRPVLLIGFAAASIALSSMAIAIFFRLSGSLPVLVALVLLFTIRLLQSALAGGVMPAAQAMVADLTTAAGRAKGMGMLGASYGLGAIAGAAMAWRMAASIPIALITLAILLAAAFAAILLFVRDEVQSRDHRHGEPLSIGAILPNLAITLLGIACYSIVQQVTALRLQDEFGYSAEQSIGKAGAILMLAAFAMAAAQLFLVRLPVWTPQRLVIAGSVLALISMAFLAAAANYLVVLAATTAFGAALGLLLPGNLADLSRRVGSGAQGKVAGVNAVAQGLGLAAGPWAGARLHLISPATPYVAALVLLLVVGLLSIFLGRQRAGSGIPKEKTA